MNFEMKYRDYLINGFAQGLVEFSTVLSYFEQLSYEGRSSFLEFLLWYAKEARFRDSDAQLAVQRSEQKSTFTPSVLLLLGRHDKIPKLPEDEQLKSLRLLLNLFAIADERRRHDVCKGACQHWWHNDLQYQWAKTPSGAVPRPSTEGRSTPPRDVSKDE
ncbi:MAG: DUF5958 family protein [Vulcanimicrobiota bacterium]